MSKKAVQPPIKKPFLARWYEAIKPEKYEGQYDKKADWWHMIIMMSIIIVLLGSIACAWYVYTENQKQQVAGQLIIPASSFTPAQLNNVESTLNEQGFKNISYDPSIGVIAYGTKEMVDEYKQSYKEKQVDPIDRRLENQGSSWADYSVLSVKVEDNGKTLRFATMTNIRSSVLADYIFNDTELGDIVDVYATWCAMNNNGEPLTVKFIGMGDEEPYLELQVHRASEIVADLEKEELDAATEENSETANIESVDSNVDENSVNNESSTESNETTELSETNDVSIE